MANKYASVLRSFRARNLCEVAIAPPADLTILSSDWLPQILNKRQNLLHIQSNFTIKRLGIFCNFADGFVFKNAWERLNVTIHTHAYARAVVTGATIDLVTGVKAATGAGFTGNLFDDNVIMVPYAGDQYQYFILDGDPADDNNLDLTDYPEADTLSAPVYLLTSLPSYETFDFTRISELNYMYEADEFITPVGFAGPTMTDLVMRVSVNQGSLAYGASDIEFLTKSISTEYEEDVAHFDLVGDVEYTAQ
jgi:hypothetical protein